MKDILKDLKDFNLPKDKKALNKIKCSLRHGGRIYWYYQEDLEFCKKIAIDPKEEKYYSGLCVIAPNLEIRTIDQELEYDECIVVIDSEPTTKCYPESTWIAINRLIDDKSLVEIYTLEECKQ